jgi:chitinase
VLSAALRGCILCVTIALAGCATPAHGHGARYRLVGYVAREPGQITAEALTALNYAFAHIDGGRVVLDAPGAADALSRLRALKSRNPRLKLLVSVGGWGADGFSDAALTDASRAKFADSAAELVAEHQLDGIDVDWEYPGLPGPGNRYRAQDKRDFTLLLQAVRGRFDRLANEQHRRSDDPYLITAALADGEFVANIELDSVGAVLDWVNLMTYDFHNSLTPTTGHHSALHRSAGAAAGERSVDAAVAQFLAAGVPAAKLVVGVPFYGRAFADVAGSDHGLDQVYGRYAGEHTWQQLASDFIGRNGYVRYWDAVAQEPYLWNAQTRTFVTYDDPQSLAIKAEFVKTRHLGGMMYWEQSQDQDGELFAVLARGLR